MNIAQIRTAIEALNWNRHDATGGTVEENKRTQLPAILAPHIAKVKALDIPARFKRDIENRDHALAAAATVIERWNAKQ
jgi:hypothetical protein